MYAAALGLQASFYFAHIILFIDMQEVIKEQVIDIIICIYTSKKCNQTLHILAREALLFPLF